MAKDKKKVPDKTETKKYSRRDFLTVGGTAPAGGPLAAFAPETPAATEER